MLIHPSEHPAGPKYHFTHAPQFTIASHRGSIATASEGRLAWGPPSALPSHARPRYSSYTWPERFRVQHSRGPGKTEVTLRALEGQRQDPQDPDSDRRTSVEHAPRPLTPSRRCLGRRTPGRPPRASWGRSPAPPFVSSLRRLRLGSM